MRFKVEHVPALTLAILPLIIAYNGHGLFATLFWMVLWHALRLAIVTNRQMAKSRGLDQTIVLNTMPISHYVEKVRWCLDRSGLDYEEEKDIGIFWILVTGRMVPNLQIPHKDIYIANSSDIIKYLYGHMLSLDEEKAKFLQASPNATELEKKLDILGHNLRRYMIYHMLVANKNSEELALKFWGLHETDIPPWQKTLLKLSFPLLKKFLIWRLEVSKENADKHLKLSEETFEELDKILSKNKFLLGTEEPTYVDISLAALAGILAWPDQYGGPRLTPESRVKMTDFSQEAQKTMKKFRGSTSGKFVLKMYAEYR